MQQFIARFFPELLLSSLSHSKDWPDRDSDCQKNSNSWLENIIFIVLTYNLNQPRKDHYRDWSFWFVGYIFIDP